MSCHVRGRGRDDPDSPLLCRLRAMCNKVEGEVELGVIRDIRGEEGDRVRSLKAVGKL